MKTLLAIALTVPFGGAIDSLADIGGPDAIESADRIGTQTATSDPPPPPEPPGPPPFVTGSCSSAAEVFAYHGATVAELDFFFGRRGTPNVIQRESLCGADTYNERSGDTGICQLTHLHSKPGYFAGTYYPGGWAQDLFGLEVGRAWGGRDRDHPNTFPACLWLLRHGGNVGTIDKQPWRASLR